MKHICKLLAFLLAISLKAQNIPDPGPAKETVRQRMDRGISKQLESVDRQRQTLRRRTDSGDGDTFFSLPALGRLAPPAPMPQPSGNLDPDARAPENEEIPPPGLIPVDPARVQREIKPIEGIYPIVEIQKAGDKPKEEPAKPAAQPPRAYIEELLKALRAQSPAAGLAYPGGAYSGLESAPLTSFSLMDWLFGL